MIPYYENLFLIKIKNTRYLEDGPSFVASGSIQNRAPLVDRAI